MSDSAASPRVPTGREESEEWEEFDLDELLRDVVQVGGQSTRLNGEFVGVTGTIELLPVTNYDVVRDLSYLYDVVQEKKEERLAVLEAGSSIDEDGNEVYTEQALDKAGRLEREYEQIYGYVRAYLKGGGAFARVAGRLVGCSRAEHRHLCE